MSDIDDILAKYGVIDGPEPEPEEPATVRVPAHTDPRPGAALTPEQQRNAELLAAQPTLPETPEPRGFESVIKPYEPQFGDVGTEIKALFSDEQPSADDPFSRPLPENDAEVFADVQSAANQEVAEPQPLGSGSTVAAKPVADTEPPSDEAPDDEAPSDEAPSDEESDDPALAVSTGGLDDDLPSVPSAPSAEPVSMDWLTDDSAKDEDDEAQRRIEEAERRAKEAEERARDAERRAETLDQIGDVEIPAHGIDAEDTDTDSAFDFDEKPRRFQGFDIRGYAERAQELVRQNPRIVAIAAIFVVLVVVVGFVFGGGDPQAENPYAGAGEQPISEPVDQVPTEEQIKLTVTNARSDCAGGSGSKAAILAFNGNDADAWVCTRAHDMDGQSLTAYFGRKVEIKTLKMNPGFMKINPNGEDQWNFHRHISTVLVQFDNDKPIVWALPADKVTAEMSPNDGKGVVAQRVTIWIQKSEMPDVLGNGDSDGLLQSDDALRRRISRVVATNRIEFWGSYR